MAVLVLLLGVVLALLAVLVAGLLRSHAEILRALHGLGVDLDPHHAAGAARAGVDVSGTTPGADAVSIAVAGTDHLTLLAFLTSGCLTCSVFWDAFADPGLEVPGDARLVIVTKGDRAESPTSVYRLAPDSVPVVMSDGAWEAYDVPVAPFFVL